MSRRKRNDNPISLFAFQDIVTSVTGILILLAIMLAISVITQGATPAGQVERVDASDLQQAKAELERELAGLEGRAKANQSAVTSWLGSSKEELEQQKKNYQEAVRITRETIEQLKVEIAENKEAVERFINDPETKATNAQVAEIQKKIDEAKKDLDKLRSGSRVFYNFRTGDRSAWIVQVSGQEILACRANERAKARVFRSTAELMKFVAGLPAAEQYLVLVVRPSGLSNFEQLKEACTADSIDVGVELIGESEVVVDPETGASSK